MVQLFVGERSGRLVIRIIKLHGAQVREVALQDLVRGLETQERVADGHCKIAGGVVPAEFFFEIGGQDLIDLHIQHFDRAGFRAWKFFLQGDGVFKLPDLLQDLDNFRNGLRAVDQVHKLFAEFWKAEEPIHPLEQGQPQAREGKRGTSQAGGDQDHAVDAVGEQLEGLHSENAAERKAHQVKAFVSQLVVELFDKFRHLPAGEAALEGLGCAVPGQFEEVDVEPLSHELRQRAPVFQFGDGGGHHDERFAFAGFHDVQAGYGQVDEVGFAGGWLGFYHGSLLCHSRGIRMGFPLLTYPGRGYRNRFIP